MRVSASFRDPSGFVYQRDGQIYRQINPSYAPHFNKLIESNLYQHLTERQLLIEHEVVDMALAATPEAWKVIRPRQVPFFSYPYEWSFSQLKDAALLTLTIQRKALKHGLILKDASAYNVQFVDGKPLFIDTLSFETYVEGKPWDAYKQFCQHFLAPLVLMQQVDIQLGRMLRLYVDGIPLDLASKMLPRRSYIHPTLFMHVHLHGWLQKRSSRTEVSAEPRKIQKSALLNIVQNLHQYIEGLEWRKPDTSWADYYDGDSYVSDSLEHKKKTVDDFVTQAQPALVWDLGANTGLFSRIASAKGIPTVALDIDPGAVELNYRDIKKNGETHLLPLLMDLTNPSPGLGWANAERDSLIDRCKADLLLALALIHHIAISNNIPLRHVAALLSQMAPWLIIEFVPKSDPKVQTLLRHREDIFPDYTRESFEATFSQFYDIVCTVPLLQSDRVLYLMRRTTQN